MNFGRSGYTQTEEWLALQREVSHFSVDQVFLFFYPVNDIADVNPETAVAAARPYFRLLPSGDLELDDSFSRTPSYRIKEWMSPIKHHSALLTLVAENYLRRQRIESAKRQGMLHADHAPAAGSLKGYLTLATENPDPVYKENYALNKRLILEMARFCKTRGIDFTLVSIDIPAYLPEEEEKMRAENPDFNPYFFDLDLEQFSRGNGIRFLGLQRVFREAHLKYGRPLHFAPAGGNTWWEYGGHTGHWNEAGHEIVAETLVDDLLKDFRDKEKETVQKPR